jgi:hypothetical protein
MLKGAWARDDIALLGLAESVAPELDARGWSQATTEAQARLVKGLLLKAADSDWSWEVATLTGRQPSEFRAALERSKMNETNA